MTDDEDSHPAVHGKPNWRPLPDATPGDPQIDFKKLLYQAQLENAVSQSQASGAARRAQNASDSSTTQTEWANEYVLQQAIYNAYIEVSKGAIERAQSRAQFIQTAAAAVGTAYAAILALSFKADSTSPAVHPLPVQGVYPALFLGLAVALSAVYLTYLTRHADVAGPAAGASLSENQYHRLEAFITWAAVPVLSRIYFLHAAVVSLAVGVALVPVVFLDLSDLARVLIVIGSLVVVFGLPGLARILSK